MAQETLRCAMSLDGFIIPGASHPIGEFDPSRPPARLEIQLVPVLLGNGTRVFADFGRSYELTFIDARPDAEGCLRLVYLRSDLAEAA